MPIYQQHKLYFFHNYLIFLSNPSFSSRFFQFMYMFVHIHCLLVFWSFSLMFLFWKLDVFVGALIISAVYSLNICVPEPILGEWGELVMLCTCSPGSEVGSIPEEGGGTNICVLAPLPTDTPQSPRTSLSPQRAPHCCQSLEQSLRFCPMVSDPSCEPALPALQRFPAHPAWPAPLG